jgi:hypothetical protein
MCFWGSVAKFQSRVTSDLDAPNGCLQAGRSELCGPTKVKSTYRAWGKRVINGRAGLDRILTVCCQIYYVHLVVFSLEA